MDLVSEEEKSLVSPFTQAPTASLIMEKEKQAEQKALPGGQSKILNKAMERAEHEAKKVMHTCTDTHVHTHTD